MRASIDRRGRVAVPRVILDRLGLTPGMTVELTERAGWLEIAVAPMAVHRVDARKGHTAANEHAMAAGRADLVGAAMEDRAPPESPVRFVVP